jgi:hypothetical protein
VSLLLEDPRDTRRYIKDQARRQTLWGFEHIPKTAGSSLVDLLQERLSPYCNIIPKTYHVAPPDFRALRMQAVQEFIDLQASLPAERRFRSFSGHLFRNNLDRIREAIPEVRLFAFVRDPVARAISDYRYCLTPAHPTHLAFVTKYPAMGDYVADMRNQNVMTKMLAPHDPALYGNRAPMTPAEVFDAVLPYFEFIGTQERYDDSVEIAMAVMGLDRVTSSKRLNVTAETPTNRVDVDVWLVEQIRAANALDVALYDEVDRRLAARIEAWRAGS